METVFFQSYRVNISEKSQLFKIYMKKSQNDTMPYTIPPVEPIAAVFRTTNLPAITRYKKLIGGLVRLFRIVLLSH